MPAHVPRRTFAKSFVITVALLPTACEKSPGPPPNPPPPDPIPTTTAWQATSATPTATSAPAQEWSIAMWGDGKDCRLVFPSGDCPKGAMCNPPPPQPFPCVPNVPKTAYPLTLTQAAGSHTCTASYTVFAENHCPPNVMCNPPPPRKETVTVPCPQ